MVGVKGSIEDKRKLLELLKDLEEKIEKLPKKLKSLKKSLNWLNDFAEIKGVVSAAADLNLEIIDENNNLGFKRAEGILENAMSLGLAITIDNDLKGDIAGKGTIRQHWQIPANPDTLKKFEAILKTILKVHIWTFKKEFEKEHSFVYPTDTKQKRLSDPFLTSETDFQVISRNFLETPEYNRFSIVNTRRERSGTKAKGAEQKLVENVWPLADPALAVHAEKAGIAFVYFDPNDITVQATEISFIWHDGTTYTVPAPIKNDTQAEFAPALAFDTENKIVAVWERVKTTNLTSEELDDMAKAMEIVWAVYDPSGDTWTEPSSLTDNAHLDHGPLLEKGTNGNLMLIWQSNSDNELISDAESPGNIRYAFWNGTAFSNPAALPGTFENCFKFSLAYDGSNATLAYVKDMDGDFSTTADEEIFYHRFSGNTWTFSTRLTNDNEADVNPRLICKNDGTTELIWLKGRTVVRLTDWNSGAYESVREESGSAAFTDFKLFSDPQNRLVLVWQDIDENGIDLFYSVYDADNRLWSKDLRLTLDAAKEKFADGAFDADGTLHLVYSKESQDDTGQNDLYHLTYKPDTDITVLAESLKTEPENPSPGSTADLVCSVENTGDLALDNIPVSFYQGNPDDAGVLIGTVHITEMLTAGDTVQVRLAWTVPQENPGEIYMVADPDNDITEKDESNNSASFSPIRMNLEILQCRVEENYGSLDIIATIKNNGEYPAEGVEVTFTLDGEELITVNGPDLAPGQQGEVVYNIWPDLDFITTEAEIGVEIGPEDRIQASDVSSVSVSYVVSSDLENAIKSLQVISGMKPDLVNLITDINADGRIGLAEAIFYLRKVAEQK